MGVYRPQGADDLLTDDGFAKPAFPNNWKGTKGLYCAGLARRGLYGAALDAQSIANDIKRALQMWLLDIQIYNYNMLQNLLLRFTESETVKWFWETHQDSQIIRELIIIIMV